MLKRSIIIPLFAFLLFLSGTKVFAQDPIFSQFYGNPLYLNPALAGAEICPRIVLNYRNQWPGIDGTVYATYSASYDQFIPKIAGGIGLLAWHDVAGQGSLTTDNVTGIYSYKYQVGKEVAMNFALQGTWFQKSVDWSKLTFGDMIDRRKGFVYNTLETKKLDNKQGWDFSAGAFAYTNNRSEHNIYGGVAVHHLTQPDEGLLTISRLPLRITGHGGAMIPVGNKRNDVSISPNVWYQKQQDFQELNLGLYLMKGAIVSGMWYRNRDAVILLIGIKQEHFRIGYSYDVTVSKLTNATYGSHEISFTMKFNCRTPIKKFSPVKCPSF